MKKAVISHLEQIADILEFKGENPFKVSAFRNAARTLNTLSGDFLEMIDSGELEKTRGIGRATYSAIIQFVDDGNSKVFTDLMSDLPNGIFELFEIRGLGPKKIAALFQHLQIHTIAQLHEAAVNGKLATVPGFAAKLIATVLSEIDRITHAQKHIYIHQAKELEEYFQNIVTHCSSFIRIHSCGQLLLVREVYSCLEFVVLVDDVHAFHKSLQSHFMELEQNGNVIKIFEFEVPLLLYVTSNSAEFSQTIVDKTIAPELSGLYERLHQQYPHLENFPFELFETEFYEVESLQSITAASDLTEDALKGMFHFHTQWSDGLHSLQDMVTAGKQFGFEYFVVCDHSKTATYANGLSAERVIHQRKEIQDIALAAGVPLYSGIESDILVTGQLDYDEDFLQTFDFIVASLHSGFSISRDAMTARIIKAIEHPKVKVLGHPTGRLLLRRDGYELDMKKVIDACAANKTALEINSNPLRLDLDWRWLRYASDKGCQFSINADAHTAENIGFVRYGVALARKGGLNKSQILNCLSKDDFLAFLRSV